MDVAIAIATTILGALLGLVVTRWDSWRETAKRSDLRGDWWAVSHGGDQDLVNDKVSITKKRGKLYIKNEGNEFAYSYEAHCLVEAANILHGTWRSTRPGATVAGRVLMIVNAQGTMISGVYTGKDKEGRDLILGWALSRNESSLVEAVAAVRSLVQLPREAIGGQRHGR
jgi:hypothetical protein